LNLSEGTICKWNKDLSKLLTHSVDKIKERRFWMLSEPIATVLNLS